MTAGHSMPPVAPVAQPLRAERPAWLTPQQAATYTGLSLTTIYLALQSGALSGVKVGAGLRKSHWRCRPVDVDKWLEAGRVKSR